MAVKRKRTREQRERDAGKWQEERVMSCSWFPFSDPDRVVGIYSTLNTEIIRNECLKCSKITFQQNAREIVGNARRRVHVSELAPCVFKHSLLGTDRPARPVTTAQRAQNYHHKRQ